MLNRIHPTTRAALIDIVKHYFAKEIKFYTHPRMRTTPQDAGSKGFDSWTNILAERDMVSKQNLPATADRFEELERTLTALYNILLLEIDAEEAFEFYRSAQLRTDGSYVADTITKENFLKIHALRNGIINNNKEDLTLLMYFIIYSDFGKSPMIREELAPFNNKLNINQPADDLIAALLTTLSDEEIATVLPSFNELTAANKARIKLYYPLMKPCFGHIMFYERGQKTFDLIAKELLTIPEIERDAAIKLLFLAQFGDGIGAQGQARIDGSINCINVFYNTYQLMHDSLVQMAQDLNSPQQEVKSSAGANAFLATVKERSAWLGFSDDWANLSGDDQRKRQVLLRVACMIRCPNGNAVALTDYFENNLTQEQQQVLLRQLSFDTQTGLESWTRVDYIATAPLNLSQNNMREGKVVEAIDEGMRASVCVAMLLEYIEATYPDITKDSSRTISLADFAFQTQDPTQRRFFYPENFDPTNYEFKFDTNRVEKKKSTALASLSLLASPAQPATVPAAQASSAISLSPFPSRPS
jgi:hypothetical protein